MYTPTITRKITKIHQNICLQCTLKETLNYKLENGGFILDQHYIYPFFVSLFSMPLNEQHQVSNI